MKDASLMIQKKALTRNSLKP